MSNSKNNETIYKSSLKNKLSIKSNDRFNEDDYLLALQIGTFLYLEYGLDRHPINNTTSSPNNLDLYIRRQLIWNKIDIDKAEKISDILLYGVFIGSIPVTPFIKKNDYWNILRLNLDVVSLNGIITDVVKMTVKRQRPDSFHREKKDNEDSFRSFFSGHTSTAFALATSNAMILSDIYPQSEFIIWTCGLSLAAATGYSRIAADKHYFSDVLCGGLMGYSIGKIIHKKRLSKNLRLSFLKGKESINLKFVIALKN